MRSFLRDHVLGRPVAFRVAAALLLGATIGAVTARLADNPKPRSTESAATADHPVDPLKATLVRCNELGQAALDEAACLAAWAKNRRRFIRRAAQSKESTAPSNRLTIMGPR